MADGLDQQAEAAVRHLRTVLDEARALVAHAQAKAGGAALRALIDHAREAAYGLAPDKNPTNLQNGGSQG